MPVLLLLSFTIASLGLAALIFAGARWAQTPQSVSRFHKAAFFIAAASWVILLRFAVVNFSWQTGTSAHAWFKRFAPIADGTAMILASFSALSLGSASRAPASRSSIARSSANGPVTSGKIIASSNANALFFPISAILAAVISLAAVANCAFPANPLTLIVDGIARAGTVWIAILPLLVILAGRKEFQRDGTLPFARVVAAMAIIHALAVTALRRIGVDPAWTASLVSFALFAALLAINIVNAPPIPQAAPARVAGIPQKWGLTARENEIVNLLIAGKTNNEIAETLFISSKTVETHLYNIYRKTDVSSRVQLVATILSGTK